MRGINPEYEDDRYAYDGKGIKGMYMGRYAPPAHAETTPDVVSGDTGLPSERNSRVKMHGLATEFDGVGPDAAKAAGGKAQPAAAGFMAAIPALATYKSNLDGTLDKLSKGKKVTGKEIYQLGDPAGGGMFGKEAAESTQIKRLGSMFPTMSGLSAGMARHSR